jgi:hypothetical protein
LYRFIIFTIVIVAVNTNRDLKEKNFAGVEVIEKKKCTLDEYLDLFAPALEWLVQNVGWHGNEELFYATCQQYKEYCNNSGILLHILASFKAAFVSKNAQVMTNLIRESDESALTNKVNYPTLIIALICACVLVFFGVTVDRLNYICN